jgi:hypothetical protein
MAPPPPTPVSILQKIFDEESKIAQAIAADQNATAQALAKMGGSLDAILQALTTNENATLAALSNLAGSLDTANASLAQIVKLLSASQVTQLLVSHSTPVPIPKGVEAMLFTSKFVKHALKAAAGNVKAGPLAVFPLVEGTGDTVTVTGGDSANNPVDISAVATITVVSDTPAVLTVSAPTGMTYTESAPGPVGTANVTITATWNDGSIGPLALTYPVSVSAGPANTLIINHGPVTVNPAPVPPPP